MNEKTFKADKATTLVFIRRQVNEKF